ncbi:MULTISPECIES: DJ-1/PfpI family protein [Paenibacillus]|uniref:DJ-1/PfpI family protein n=1 Tax=Paenibacillus TaxID=44249 RepID=UPI00091CEBA0|nr:MULTISPECIES: DJ-1/PfpI family protein [Paenibacillus]MCZ1266194.1 DJ-1/PfpI family protein [Paenibacillus tundrae]WDQ35252.1 DJ-1/PfpI family protein [Paenibacillus marchantiae]SHN72530.1 cyclohexyl-isocyanide hydratase [Paenibacillus sp. ov031]SLK13526.1 cyclohexyl-isocyanide hydratase [Paenibacillus sp. RU5A]SOC73052.1 cyclohexyl-isocyanide hydratase [Paenibacillus sp. RU26A]
MKIAFVLFDGLTFLDFAGFYDVINRLNFFEQTKGTTWETCAMTDQVTDESGLTLKVDRVKPNLAEYDLIFVPGGMGTRKLRFDEAFVGWLRQAENVPLKVSVCTGSLLMGAAGFLTGKKATTHPNVYELLEPYVAEVIQTRIVKDGNVITAGGVATSIDLGVYVVGLLAGQEAAANVKLQIDYPYDMQGVVEE